MSTFTRTPLNARCPICGRAIRMTLDDFKWKRAVRCPAGHQVQLSDPNHGVQQVERSVANLKRSVNRLNQQLRRRR